MAESRPRSGWLLWLGSVSIVLAGLATFLLIPFRECPNCEGSGLGVHVRSGPGYYACKYCCGHSRVSLYRKWTTKTEETFVCGVDMRDYRPYIKPLLDREHIPAIPGDGSLGNMDLLTDSPPHARRARKLLEQDAREKGYRIY